MSSAVTQSQPNFSTLVELVRHRAKTDPDRVVYIFLKDAHIDQARITYSQLDLAARRIAVSLRQWVGVGERALICHLPGLDYITSFFGCLYAGVIAVPVYPPRFNPKLGRIDSIVSDVNGRVALTSKGILENLAPLFQE